MIVVSRCTTRLGFYGPHQRPITMNFCHINTTSPLPSLQKQKSKPRTQKNEFSSCWTRNTDKQTVEVLLCLPSEKYIDITLHSSHYHFLSFFLSRKCSSGNKSPCLCLFASISVCTPESKPIHQKKAKNPLSNFPL